MALSFLEYTQLQGDQVVIVPNGTYQGTDTVQINTAHPATAGPYEGWLILKAETQGEVIVDLTPPASTLTGTLSSSNGQNGRITWGPNASRIMFVGFQFKNGLMDVNATKNSTDNIVFWYCTFGPFTPARWISYHSDTANPQNGYYRGARLLDGFWVDSAKFLGCDFLSTGTALGAASITNLVIQGCDFIGPFDHGGFDNIIHPNAFSSYMGNSNVQILDTTMRGRCNFADNNAAAGTAGGQCSNIAIRRFINISNVLPNQFISLKPSDPRGIFGVMEDCYIWDPDNPTQQSRVDYVDSTSDFNAPYNQTPSRINVSDGNNVNYMTAFPGYPNSIGVNDYMTLWRNDNPYENWNDNDYFSWPEPTDPVPEIGEIVPTVHAQAVSSATSTTYTTASFTATLSNEVLIGVLVCRGSGTPSVPTSIAGDSITGAVQVADTLFNTVATPVFRLCVWRATGTGAAGTVTITLPGSGATALHHAVIECDGASGSDFIIQTDGAAEESKVTTDLDLATFGAGSNATIVFAAHDNSGSAMSAGAAPWEELGTATTDTSPQSRLSVFFNVGNDTTPDVTWTTSRDYGAIALELEATNSGTLQFGAEFPIGTNSYNSFNGVGSAVTTTATMSFSAGFTNVPDAAPPAVTGTTTTQTYITGRGQSRTKIRKAAVKPPSSLT
jgi:hypothetical protein